MPYSRSVTTGLLAGLAVLVLLGSIPPVSQDAGAAVHVPPLPQRSPIPTPAPMPAPAPVPVRWAGVPGPEDTSSHWWEGGEYDGTSTTATALNATITVPDDFPDDTSNFYYVLLSAWDNAGSYDQIGFAADNGQWGTTFSWTDDPGQTGNDCATTYHYTPDAYHLTRGTVYDFVMTIASGIVKFAVENSGGGIFWSLDAPTNGTAFEVDTTYTCLTNSGETYGGYTDYEEAYTTTQTMPSYSFAFTGNEVGSSAETSWKAFSADGTGAPPTSVAVGISGSTVTVENQAFNLSFFHGGFDHVAVGQGTVSVQKQVFLGSYAADGTISLSTSCLGSGWSTSFTTTSGAAPFMTTLTVTIPAAAALGTYCVRILAIDTSGLYTRLLYNVTVETPITLSAPTFSPPAVDVGQTMTISTTASGGSGTYTFYWSGLPASCPFSYSSGFFCAPGVTGYYHVNVSAVDTLGLAASAGPSVLVVVPDVTAMTPVANRTSADVNQSVTYSVTASGGTGVYHYTWTSPYVGLGCVLANAATISCFPNAPGTGYTVSVNVSDTNGYSTPVYASAGFTVYADPVLSLPTATPATVDLGQSVVFSTTLTGGSGGVTPTWFGLPSGCSGGSALAVSCTPSSLGTSHIYITGRDSNGYPAQSATLTFVVNPKLTVGPVSGSRPSGDVGQAVSFSVTASGGAGGYTYVWAGLPIGCASSSVTTLACTPTSAGSASISVTVTDASSTSVTSTSLSYLVWPDPVVSKPTATPTAIDLGSIVALAATASSGAGSLTLAWSGLPAGCSSTQSSFSCTPSASGEFTIALSATDTNGFTVASLPLDLNVSIDPTVVVASTPWTLDLGQTFEVTTTVTGGSGGGTYTYDGLNGSGCPGESASSFSCTPTQAGKFSISVHYVDSNGFFYTTSASVLLVNPALSIASFTASPSPATAGSAATISVVAVGGWPAYTYSYSSLPTGCASANATSLTCTFPAVGTFTLNVTVSDRAGAMVTMPLHLQVQSPPSSPSGLAWVTSTMGLEVVALVAVVAIALVAGVVLSHRRKKAEASPAPPSGVPPMPPPPPMSPPAYPPPPPPPPG